MSAKERLRRLSKLFQEMSYLSADPMMLEEEVKCPRVTMHVAFLFHLGVGQQLEYALVRQH